MKKTISFSLRSEEYDRIKAYADKKGLTPSAFVKMSAFHYMVKYSGKRNVKQSAPFEMPSDKDAVKPYYSEEDNGKKVRVENDDTFKRPI